MDRATGRARGGGGRVGTGLRSSTAIACVREHPASTNKDRRQREIHRKERKDRRERGFKKGSPPDLLMASRSLPAMAPQRRRGKAGDHRGEIQWEGWMGYESKTMRKQEVFTHPIHPIYPGPYAFLCDLLPFLCASVVNRRESRETSQANLTDTEVFPIRRNPEPGRCVLPGHACASAFSLHSSNRWRERP